MNSYNEYMNYTINSYNKFSLYAIYNDFLSNSQ